MGGNAVSTTAFATMLLGLPLLQPQQAPPAYPEGVWIDFRQGVERHGLEYVEAFQCSHKVTTIDGVGCAQTETGGPQAQCLRFQAPREMIRPDRDTLTFEVEVYDGSPHPFMLQVESSTPSDATGLSFYHTLPTIQRHGTPKWRWVRWQVTDPAFCDPARDGVRFQFYDEAWRNDGRLLSVSQVRVTHEAVVFRPQQDAVLCGERLPVAAEGYDKAGQPLPDGTALKLATRPGTALAECPQSVVLRGGKADFEVVAGAEPGTVSLCGVPAGAQAWAGRPIYILAGQGKLEERTELVTGEQLATTARFEGGAFAGSSVATFTDDQGEVALRGQWSFKQDAGQNGWAELVLDVPLAGVPRRLTVCLGCPDQTVDSVGARIRDAHGEIFSYCLEPILEGRALPEYAERTLECRALAGPTWVAGPGSADGVMDLPCSLYSLGLTPMPGLPHGEIDVWRFETDILAPTVPPGPTPAQTVPQGAEPVAAPPVTPHTPLVPQDAAAEQHYQRGLELKRVGQAAQAADEFRAALATDPKHVRAHYALGWVLLDLKDKTGAAVEFRKVFELAPASDEAKEAQKALDRIGA